MTGGQKNSSASSGRTRLEYTFCIVNEVSGGSLALVWSLGEAKRVLNSEGAVYW